MGRVIRDCRVTVRDIVAVAFLSLLLLSIAVENGYPILFTDSIGYQGSALEIREFIRSAFLHLFGGGVPISWPGGARPKVYAAFLLITNGGSDLWLSITVQVIINSWLIWLLIKWLRLGRAADWTIGIGPFLAGCTSLPWVDGMLMPDAFTGPLILSVFLLAAGWAEHGSFVKILLILTAALSFAAHPSHIALAFGLVVLLVVAKMVWHHRITSIRLMPPIVSISLGWTTLVLSGLILLGVISPIGARTPQPFLLARFIADGPVREYLADNCSREKWALCPYQALLTNNPDNFIWNPNLPWAWEHGDPNLRARIRNEQAALLWSTFKQRGTEMILSAFMNGVRQFFRVSPDIISFARPERARALATLTELPNLTNRVASSLQGREDAEAWFWPPVRFLTDIVVLCAGILVSVAVTPRLRNAASRGSAGRIWLLVLFIAIAAAENALVCGGLAAVHGRYQARVIWLIPFVTFLVIGSVYQGRKSVTPAAAVQS